jgi:opacity protein-like surface antigen
MTPMNSKDLVRDIVLAAAIVGVLPLAGLCALAEPAVGADFGQPFPAFPAPAPLADKVEFASNWYVRGDLAYAQETFPNISPFTFGSSPSMLNTFSAGVGGGYKVNNWFRTDLILDYRSRVRTAGTGAPGPCAIATGSGACFFDTTIQRWDLLANGYLDLGTWDGFTPYIGAGAGTDWARIWQSNGFSTASNTHYRFAWAAMAGIAIAMTDHAQLDVGYRFLDLGPIGGLSSVTGTTVTQRVRANEVRAGVRYMID